MSTTVDAAPIQVHRIYIKATPQAVWDAITKPEWTDRYGYGGLPEYDLTAGAQYIVRPGPAMAAVAGVPDVIIDGEIVESDPPRRLVQTWRMLMDPDLAAEGFTRLTYEIESLDGGATRLTVIHDLTNAPKNATMTAGGMESRGGGGGWAWVLSDLKSLLETGSPLGG